MTALLNTLLDEAALRFDAFQAAVRDAGYVDEWDAYRREIGTPWPQACTDAHAAWMNALHAYYLARDGSNGFLGGKGQ